MLIACRRQPEGGFMSAFIPVALTDVLSLTFANADEKSPACLGEESRRAQALIWLIRQENPGGCLADMTTAARGSSH